MRNGLIFLFGVMFCAMLGATILAAADRNIVDAGRELFAYPWFRATLLDAYLAFLTFYVWVAYKERSLAGRVVWLILIVSFGSMALAAYVLLQIAKTPRGSGWNSILLRPSVDATVTGPAAS